MNITPKALEEFKKALDNNEDNMSGIRIFTQQGCCGPAINMAIVEKSLNGDKIIVIDSVKFFVDSSAEEMLEGVTVDYGQNGFRLDGMKRSGGCCG